MQETIKRMEAEKATLEAQNAALKVTSEAATAAKDAAEAAAAAAAAGGPSAGALADAMLKKAAAKLAEDRTGPRGIAYYTKTASKKNHQNSPWLGKLLLSIFQNFGLFTRERFH